MAKRVAQYDAVRITTNRLADEGAPVGTVGFVLEIYEDGNFEVEVCNPDGSTAALVVASPGEVEPAGTTRPRDRMGKQGGSGRKQRYLACYDYGMGAVWLYVWAYRPADVVRAFPELEMIDSEPALWTDADRARTTSAGR